MMPKASFVNQSVFMAASIAAVRDGGVKYPQTQKSPDATPGLQTLVIDNSKGTPGVCRMQEHYAALRAASHQSRQALWQIFDSPLPPDAQDRLDRLRCCLLARRMRQDRQPERFPDSSGSRLVQPES